MLRSVKIADVVTRRLSIGARAEGVIAIGFSACWRVRSGEISPERRASPRPARLQPHDWLPSGRAKGEARREKIHAEGGRATRASLHAVSNDAVALLPRTLWEAAPGLRAGPGIVEGVHCDA